MCVAVTPAVDTGTYGTWIRFRIPQEQQAAASFVGPPHFSMFDQSTHPSQSRKEGAGKFLAVRLPVRFPVGPHNFHPIWVVSRVD